MAISRRISGVVAIRFAVLSNKSTGVCRLIDS